MAGSTSGGSSPTQYVRWWWGEGGGVSIEKRINRAYQLSNCVQISYHNKCSPISRSHSMTVKYGFIDEEVVSSFSSPGHKVHPFLDDPQLYYKFCDLNSSSSSSSSERSAPLVGGRLQQLMNLFSFSRNSTPSSSPAPSPTPRRRPNSGSDVLTNGRPRWQHLY